MDIIKYLPPGAREFIGRHPKFGLAFKSFGYLFSERIVKIIVGFFVHALVARHLGPVHFGKLSYIVKTVSIFFAFGTFGVDELIIKHLMDGKYPEEDIIKTVFKLRLKMSLLGLIFLGVFLLIFKPEGWIFTLIAFLYGINIIFQAFNVFDLTFHSKMDFQPLFWANNISYIFSSSLRCLGVWLKLTMSFFLSTYLVGEIILKALIVIKIGIRKAFAGKSIKSLETIISKESFPFFLTAFVTLLDQRVSFMFIEKYRSLTELGNYSVAVTLVDLWLFLPMAVCSAVFPTIVTAFNGNRAKYEIRIQYLTDMMVWTSIFFSIGVFISSDFIIKVLYGLKYQDAPYALSWFALTTIPVFFNLARVKWMTLEGKLVDWFWISMICLLINIAAHIYLVPVHGIKGAIVSFLVSQMTGNLIATFFLRSNRKAMKLFLSSFHFPFRLLKRMK